MPRTRLTAPAAALVAALAAGGTPALAIDDFSPEFGNNGLNVEH